MLTSALRATWVILLACSTSQAATIQSEASKLSRSQEQVTPLKGDLFGDHINLYNGTFEFTQTDVSLPGNNALPVSVSRRLRTGITRPLGPTGAFADWDFEIPHIEGVVARAPGGRMKPCSQFGAPGYVESQANSWFAPQEYWHGYFLHLPGSGATEMLKKHAASDLPSDGAVYGAVTSSKWVFRCEPGTDHYTGIAPDGTQYYFDRIVDRQMTSLTKWDPNPAPYRPGEAQPSDPVDPAVRDKRGPVNKAEGFLLGRYEQWRLPTRIVDKFGNWVEYDYANATAWAPWRIRSSDGRMLTLNYNGSGFISSVSDGYRTWTYNYRTTTTNVNPGTAVLGSVQQPDGSAYTFTVDALGTVGDSLNDTGCDGVPPTDPPTFNFSGSMTHPSGAAADFSMRYTQHGRSHVDRLCWGNNYENADYAIYPRYMPAWSITSKTIRGPGLEPTYWTYGYGPDNASWSPCNGCIDYKTVTVAQSGGNQAAKSTQYFFGNRYNHNDGLLLRVDEGIGTGVTRATLYDFRLDPAGQYHPTYGDSPQTRSVGSLSPKKIPQWARTIHQDGAWYQSLHYNYDNRARPIDAVRHSSSGQSKTETMQYQDFPARWVMDLPKRKTVNNFEVERQEYNGSTTNLEQVVRNGLLIETLGYNGDGTLASRTDGNNKTTGFGSYKRGVPQSVSYPNSTSESAVIHDTGAITSITNGASKTTVFELHPTSYRLARIIPPGDNGVAWHPTNVTFEQIGAADVGLPAGHWRQIVTTGNAISVNHFDGLWRPLLTRKYDAASPGTTGSAVVRRYNIDGQTVFESYPQRENTNVNTYPSGTATTYDSLGRIAQVMQDSEQGILTTATTYVNGQRSVRNPRNQYTTTAFQAFYTPTEDAPIQITAPEDTNTTISRDVWGKATAIRRWGNLNQYGADVTRTYVYDGNHRLCKTIEPESGATLLFYDGASNVAWRAPGQPLPAAVCDYNSVPASAKISFAYDGLNQLTYTAFGDGSPDIGRSYTGDGLLETINSNNLNWTYTYNNRRLLVQERLSVDGWQHALGYGFDSNGNVARTAYPNGAYVDWAPDAFGHPTKAYYQPPYAGNALKLLASNVVHDPRGQITDFVRGGNAGTYYANFLARGLPYQHLDGSFINDVYQYDQNANVTSITDYTTSGQTFGQATRAMIYDGVDRLTVTSAQNLWSQAIYTYDSVDNLRRTVVGGRTADHRFDAYNRMVSYEMPGSPACAYGYDARGNTNQRCAQGFAFDLNNRLQSAWGFGVGTYRYDGHNRRTRIAYGDGSWKVQVYSQAGKLMYGSSIGSSYFTTNYVYLGGRLVAEVSSNPQLTDEVVTNVHTDALGSPVARSSETGALAQLTRYEAFGPTWSRDCRFTEPGFTGHVNDDTCMVYMQQRYYDPWAGRFLSVDPVTTDAKTGGHFNRYVYAANNPYKYTDPDGRAPHIALGAVIGGIAGGIGAARAPDSSLGSIALGAAGGALAGAISAAAPVAGFAVVQGFVAGFAGNVVGQAVGSPGEVPSVSQAVAQGAVSALGAGVGQAAAAYTGIGLASATSQGVGTTVATAVSTAINVAMPTSAGGMKASTPAPAPATSPTPKVSDKVIEK